MSLSLRSGSGDELQDGEDHDDHADDVEDAVHRAILS
jgi:hypothetical protein